MFWSKAKTSLGVFFADPPTVSIETMTDLEDLEDGKDIVDMRCIVDSNPPSTITWRKEGLSDVYNTGPDLTLSPVTRHTNGLYSCTAENALGMSKPEFVSVDVKCKFENCGNQKAYFNAAPCFRPTSHPLSWSIKGGLCQDGKQDCPALRG